MNVKRLNGLIQPFLEPERVIGFFNAYRECRRRAPNRCQKLLDWPVISGPHVRVADRDRKKLEETFLRVDAPAPSMRIGVWKVGLQQWQQPNTTYPELWLGDLNPPPPGTGNVHLSVGPGTNSESDIAEKHCTKGFPFLPVHKRGYVW